MLREVGCSHVIVGHSERRTLFGETDANVNRKARAALEHFLQVAVGFGGKRLGLAACLLHDLLRVLLSEHRDIRSDHVEQLEHHRRHATEVSRPRGAFVALREPLDRQPAAEPLRVDLVVLGREQDVHPRLGGQEQPVQRGAAAGFQIGLVPHRPSVPDRGAPGEPAAC